MNPQLEQKKYSIYPLHNGITRCHLCIKLYTDRLIEKHSLERCVVGLNGSCIRIFTGILLFIVIVSNMQIVTHNSQYHTARKEKHSIAQVEDTEGPIFGYSWEYFLNHTIGFEVTTGGTNYTYSHTFSTTVYDQSGIDTLLLYYYVGSLGEWYLNKEQIPEQVSWILCDTVLYDAGTNSCSTTLYFDPPIINDPIFAFYWANDTFGNEARGGLQCYYYSGANPIVPPYFLSQNFLSLFVITITSIIGITYIIIKKRSDVFDT